MTHANGSRVQWGTAILGIYAALLAGCGGASGDGSAADAVGAQARATSSEVRATADPSAFARSAALSSADLAAAEQQAQAAEIAPLKASLEDLKPGQIAPKSAYLSGEIARKAATLRIIPAYRFYNASTGAHFYTTSETERAHVAAALSPPFSYDGPAFSVASDFSAGLSSVHRFYNTRTGVHFYTISETERANVVATLPHFTYEGVAYYASQVAGAGLVPLHRFYVPSRGFHFYTASATERATIEGTLSATYTYEGIGYYVLDSGWAERVKVPHTGVGGCYRVSASYPYTTCDRSETGALNSQQDGHRVGINPMRYESVPSIFGPYAYVNCVRDSVTGLVWEGKTVAGERAGSNTYTYLGNSLPTDTSGYVAAVNASALCGFTDWRMPTRQELLNLVNFGGGIGPNIDTTYFPNTPRNAVYWASESDRLHAGNAWYVTVGDYPGNSQSIERTFDRQLRLVRGDPTPATAMRFTYSTVSNGSDAVNNLVNDAWTGLQWRRCEEGRTWTGTTCTGPGTNFSHESALSHARDQSGWRLPNVKELATLSVLGTSVSSQTTIDQTAFPGALDRQLWTTTPYSRLPDTFALYVDFFSGTTGGTDRSVVWGAARLVRANP